MSLTGAAAAGSPATPGTGGEHVVSLRLDGGLAKTCPEGKKLTRQSYRTYRRGAKIFQLSCQRRGPNVVSEGALLMLQLQEGDAWLACEYLDIEDLEQDANAFATILGALDKLYHYDDRVELPNRTESFFDEFARLKGETLQEYVLRHSQEIMRLKELRIELPDTVVGWHMLSRSGVPAWQLPTVRSACGHTLESDKVREALLMMFGADSKPHQKDVSHRGGVEQRTTMMVSMSTKTMATTIVRPAVLARTTPTTKRKLSTTGGRRVSPTTKSQRNWTGPMTIWKRPM